jgi:hypothetical protein
MKLVINGADVELDGRYAKTPLPWVLRDVAGLHGAKFGCGAGFCAARTVLIDWAQIRSPARPRPSVWWARQSPQSRGPPARLPTPPAFEGGQRGIEAVRYVEQEG